MKRAAFVAVLVVVSVVPVWSPHDLPATHPLPYTVPCRNGAVVHVAVDPATPDGLTAAGEACQDAQRNLSPTTTTQS